VKGVETMKFQLESRGLLKAKDTLFVPGLKKNLFIVLVIEDKWHVVIFKNG